MVIRKATPAARAGFTLMEMLVVVAIIVALAALGGFYYMRSVDEAKKNVAHTQVKLTLTQAVTAYKLEMGEWPPTLDALLRTSDGVGPWLDSADALKDPWGRDYMYHPGGPNNNSLKPDIWSESPHGQIGNWMTTRR